jgi:hypothetical protein
MGVNDNSGVQWHIATERPVIVLAMWESSPALTNTPTISAAYRTRHVLVRSRNALAMTDTELRLIAAALMTGLRRRPKNG